MKKKLLPALLLTFVNVIGFTILIPILPFIVESYGASQVWYGALLSAYAFSLFYGAPILGGLSDVFGRKKLLLISHLGTLLSWAIFGFALTMKTEALLLGAPLPLLIILGSRILDGITGGNNSVVSAYVSDVTTSDERGKAFGLIGATFGLGFMIGPALGGFTANLGIGYLGTILFAATVSTLTLASIATQLKEPQNKRREESWTHLVKRRIDVIGTIKELKGRKVISSTLSVKFLAMLSFSGFTSILSLFLIDRFGLTETGVGLFLLVIGAYQIFNQAVLVPKIIKQFGGTKTLFAGITTLAIGVIIAIVPQNQWLFAAFAYVFSLGIAITIPTVKTILSKHASEDEQGEILGLDEALQSLAQGIMPIFSATLYVIIGPVVFVAYGLFLLSTGVPLAYRALKHAKQASVI